MKLVLHIFRKDFRHLRFYLAGWLGLLIVAPVVVTLELRLQVFSIVLIGVLKIVLLALIVSSLVQSDSLVGSTAFWLSRPVSARQLLAAKSVFLAGTLIFPTLLVEVLILFFYGVTARDILRSIPETLFYTLVAVAILMVLAALTRSLLKMLAFGLVTVFVMALFAMVAVGIFSPFDGSAIDPMARMTLQSSKWIGFFLCLMVTAGIMVCVQYLTRRTKLNTILTLSALFPCILPMEFWTWDLVAAMRKPERTIVDPERFPARIDHQSLRFYQEASTSLRDKRMVLHGKIVVENHPPDLIVVPLKVVSHVSFGSGDLSFDSGDFGYSEWDVNKYENRQLRAGRFEPGASDLDDGRVEVLEEALGDVRLFANKYRLEPGYVPKFLEIPLEDYDRKAATGGKLSAKVDFLIQKLEITPLAMEEGARYRRGSDHAEVLEVTILGKRKKTMWISLKESSHRLLPHRPKSRWYVLRNRSRGEAILGDERNSNFFGVVPFLLPTVSSNNLRLNFSLVSIDPSYGPEWFEGAELFRIDITYLGAVSKSLRIQNLVMNRIPGP